MIGLTFTTEVSIMQKSDRTSYFQDMSDKIPIDSVQLELNVHTYTLEKKYSKLSKIIELDYLPSTVKKATGFYKTNETF